MVFGVRRVKVLGYVSMELFSKISNLCDPDPPTSQTDRQTDGRHAISIPRYALVHRAVKMARTYATYRQRTQRSLQEESLKSLS